MLLRSGSRANALGRMAQISSPSNTMRPGGLVQQPHHHHRSGGFAAAGFARPSPTLSPWPHGKADCVDPRELFVSTGGCVKIFFFFVQRRRGALTRIFLDEFFDEEKRFLRRRRHLLHRHPRA